MSLYCYNVNQMFERDAVKDAAARSSRHLPALNANHVGIRDLEMDFKETEMSYNDDERHIRSGLFIIPSPKLRISVIDHLTSVTQPFLLLRLQQIPLLRSTCR